MTATNFEWAIANMDRQLADGTVTTIHYTVSAHDGTYSSGAYGSIGLDPADPDTMIPFADLTPEIVVTWVQHKLTGEKVAEIEAALQQQIDLQRNPVTGQGLPWGN
jgi:hypothetical protein